MKLLRAAIIGLGVGERHIEGYNLHPRCQVVALCDNNIEKLNEVGSKYPKCRLLSDASDILNDASIDVVSIASFDNYHREQVIQALDRGKHVFVEKPLCLTDDEFKDIVNALERSPRLHLSSNFVLRREPRFIELKSRIEAGKIGDVYYFDGDYDYGRLHKILYGWRSDIPNYSVFLGGGIHLVDLICWLSRKKVIEVFAYGAKISTKNSKFPNSDFVVTLLKLTDGVVVKISANFGSVTPHHHKISIYGTKGTFIQSHLETAYIYSRNPDIAPERVYGIYPGTSKGDMIPSFIQQILGEGVAEVKKQEVLDSMSVCLAIERSLKSGFPQAVDYCNN
jgi:predicted dehydrogenase